MADQLSASLEDYLEAIAELIAVEGHAHTKEIADKLKVKMPSVTGALRQLEKLGYILYNTHYPVQLTPAGEAIAADVIHRHQALQNFFSRILGLPSAKAEESACRIEHLVDADTVRRFVLFSEAIEKRSDALSLQTYLTEAMSLLDQEDSSSWRPLPDFEPGSRLTITRIGRLAAASELPFQNGNTLILDSLSLDRQTLHFRIGTKSFSLPLAVAENIWGAPVPEIPK